MTRNYYKRAFSLAEITITIIIISLILAIVQYGVGFYEESQIVKARSHSKNSPINHMSNLIIWYETSLDDNFKKKDIADGDDVEIWHNRAINFWQKNNANQSSLSNRAIYKERVFNDNISGLYFDGANDFMNFNADLLINSDFSFFVVETRLRGATNDYYIGGLGGSGQNFHMGYASSTAARFGIYGASTSNYSIAAYLNPVARINTLIFSKKSGTKFWVNGGVNPDQTNSATSYLSSYQGARIGDTENAHFYQGYIAEIIVFNRAIRDQERNDIEKYLGTKYNIKIDD